MHKIEINHDDEPIRLFKSNFLEFFTHITPQAVLLIWSPVVILFIIQGITHAAGKYYVVALAFVLGLFLWSLAEYLLHRFVFHFPAKTPAQERIAFLFHGVHHAQPKMKTRLVMPPAVSIPLALVFWGLFHLIFSVFLQAGAWTAPTFGGFITGYIIYDMMHYATHHFPMRRGIWKALKRHHLQHHYKNPGLQFGVSSPLWDYVFTTIPKGG